LRGSPRRIVNPLFTVCVCFAAMIILEPVFGQTATARASTSPANLQHVGADMLMPQMCDYTFMWWAYGWRGRSPRGEKVLAIQTGRYGLAIDVEKASLLHLGAIEMPLPYSQAASSDNAAVFGLGNAELVLEAQVGQERYRCVRATVDQHDAAGFPVRLIESGRYVQRADIDQLQFENEKHERLGRDGRLEIVAWPDRVTFLLSIEAKKDQPPVIPRIGLKTSGHPAIANGDITESAGSTSATHTAWLSANYGDETNGDVEVQAASLAEHRPLPVTQDSARGWQRVELAPEAWRENKDFDHLERVRLTLANRASHPSMLRLLLAKDYPFAGVTGMTPMLRDEQGNPTGIAVQLSKDWHKQADRTILYEGPWFHGYTMLRMPALSQAELEFTMAYARWGGVPAASHAQLSLVGYGGNQLWDQAALGSWGESICYDPDVGLGRSMIDDVRPLMVTAMNAPGGRWSWTNNVGGGDFLVYENPAGQRQFLSRMKTAYLSQGPNLTHVIYSGASADGNIAARIEVSTPRSDDINRAIHHVRYDVLKPTGFSRLAFYQVGADHYNALVFEKAAWGNLAGLQAEWKPKRGGDGYRVGPIELTSEAPWVSEHGLIGVDASKGPLACRGLIVRSWRARLGGREVAAPWVALHGTNDGNIPSLTAELVPPPDVKRLLPGDFVEASLELAIVPQHAEDYYGPNANLRAALSSGADTWRPVLREARGNQLRATALHGTILNAYPLLVKVDQNGRAQVVTSGGVGYVPVTFSGLSDFRGYGCDLTVDGVSHAVDQAVSGNDFWQSDYDAAAKTWSLTYNICLDSPRDEARAVSLTLSRR
jgi:hypothetical protein